MAQLPGWEPSPPDAVASLRVLAIATAGAGVLASALWTLLTLQPHPARLALRIACAVALPLLALGVLRHDNRMRIALGLLALLPAAGGLVTGGYSALILVTGNDLDSNVVTALTVDIVLSGIQAGFAVELCRQTFSAPVAAWCRTPPPGAATS